jgi:hypothetical protein
MRVEIYARLVGDDYGIRNYKLRSTNFQMTVNEWKYSGPRISPRESGASMSVVESLLVGIFTAKSELDVGAWWERVRRG